MILANELAGWFSRMQCWKSFATIFSGKELLGLEYEPLFDIPSLKSEKSYKIYPADFVTTTDGTGVVHTAVMYGEDDYALGKKIGLPQHHTVNEEGKFTREVKGFEGQYVKSKETEDQIFKHLEKNGNLLKTTAVYSTNIRSVGVAALPSSITPAIVVVYRHVQTACRVIKK